MRNYKFIWYVILLLLLLLLFGFGTPVFMLALK